MNQEASGSALTVEQALEQVISSCRAVAETEVLGIGEALDRVLGRPVVARLDVPPARNSAMDGYAVHAGRAEVGERLRIVGTAAAGHPWDGTIGPGECIRILTGAVIPASADAVLMQEDVALEGDFIRPSVAARRGDHVRERGEDTRAGQEILQPGRRITAADIALLASQGIPEIEVHRRVRVSLFSTGDELVPVGQPLGPGQIHDSNRYALRALLERFPVDIIDLGVIEDREDVVRQALRRASEESDLILTTGGVSVGDADYVARVLQDEGEVGFWKILMKPGRPLAFGRFGQALFLGLPGNPVSSMATFSLFVRPALLRLAGTEAAAPWTFAARLVEGLKKRPGRADYQRGVLTRETDGSWSVRSTGGQGSHQLRSMSLANCYIVLPRDQADATAGEWVEVMPFQSVF